MFFSPPKKDALKNFSGGAFNLVNAIKRKYPL